MYKPIICFISGKQIADLDLNEFHDEGGLLEANEPDRFEQLDSHHVLFTRGNTTETFLSCTEHRFFAIGTDGLFYPSGVITAHNKSGHMQDHVKCGICQDIHPLLLDNCHSIPVVSCAGIKSTMIELRGDRIVGAADADILLPEFKTHAPKVPLKAGVNQFKNHRAFRKYFHPVVEEEVKLLTSISVDSDTDEENTQKVIKKLKTAISTQPPEDAPLEERVKYQNTIQDLLTELKD